MKRPESEKKEKKKRGCLIVLIVFLALIVVALIAATIFINHMLGKISREDEVIETLSQEDIEFILNETEPEDMEYTVPVDENGETIPEETVVMPETPVESVAKSDNVINILLVGQDTYSNRSRSRTDTMILCTVNKETKTLTMTSFMRDLYVVIPGYADQRLNVPYVLGGFNKLYQTLEHNFGVEVEHGVAVNFSSFPKVIDAVGGVDIDLTSKEANYLNRRSDNEWTLSEGVNRLDGEQALEYSRIRKLDSDFGRTNRQRKVLTAVLNRAKKLSVAQLYDLVETLMPLVHTDMTDAEMITIAAELIPLLTDIEIVTQRIPVNGGYKSRMIKGMAVLVPDTEVNRQFLEDTIGG